MQLRRITCLISATTWLLVFSQTKINVYHTNDINMHFFRMGAKRAECITGIPCYGGLTFLQKELEKADKDKHVLRIDTGNFFSTKNLTDDSSNSSKLIWERFYDVVNHTKYDVMALGEAELSGGKKALKMYMEKMLQNAKSHFVCSDLTFSIDTPEGKFLNDTCHHNLVRMFNLLKIGIVSHSATDMKVPPGVKVNPEGLQSAIKELKHEFYVDIIMVLDSSNQVVTEDSRVVDDGNADIVFSGHLNALFYNGDTAPHGAVPDFSYPYTIKVSRDKQPTKEVYVAGSYGRGAYLGHLRVQSNMERSGQKFSVLTDSNPSLLTAVPFCRPEGAFRISNTCPENPVLYGGYWFGPGPNYKPCDPPTRCADYPSYYQTLKQYLGGIVGGSVYYLSGGRKCWRQECGMGNMIADAMVAMVTRAAHLTPKGSWTSASVAILHGTMITDGFLKGDIYRSQIDDVLIKDSKVVMVTMIGKHLHSMIKESVDVFHSKKFPLPGFLQVSGISARHERLTGHEHHRILRLKVLCSKCQTPEFKEVRNDSTEHISVVLPAESFQGGLLHRFGVSKNHKFREIFPSLRQMMSDYIKKYSPIMVPEGDRLVHAKHRNMPLINTTAGDGSPLRCWVVLIPLALLVCRTL